MSSNNTTNSVRSQRNSPLTTLAARSELDIIHPSARVMGLKAQGHNIVTHWETVDSGKAKHRIASYVLMRGSVNGQ